mmetsp:Transcript_72144/g.204517  ORF Transcript_72144/g.204517 Transcript_72144/m.204517 type:complete len:199 (-) Transcript_72144:67-663(-)
MNFSSVPIKNPHTQATHFGPGTERGGPYYHLGQECHKAEVPRGNPLAPLDLSATKSLQRRANDATRERTLHVFRDPPSARSCRISHNKDGLVMDSHSHYTKIGSKHLCDPRSDHTHALKRATSNSASLPDLRSHPSNLRRSMLRDPAPYMMNAAFSTSSSVIGQCYHKHLAPDPAKLGHRHPFDMSLLTPDATRQFGR